MKTIEIRRHSIRNKPGPDISEQGVTLARLVGLKMGPFDRVITSPLPRALQTAQAMGFTADSTEPLIAAYGDEVEMECPWPASFSDYAAACRRGGAAFSYAQRLAVFYEQLAESLPEGGAALVVNHGGVVELSAVGCLPAADFLALGDYIECCEGIRLAWENGQFTSVEALRV